MRRSECVALHGRGVKLMKGYVAASNADFELPKDIKPSIADEFYKLGVSAQVKSGFWREQRAALDANASPAGIRGDPSRLPNFVPLTCAPTRPPSIGAALREENAWTIYSGRSAIW
jgi:hypothetical protein